MSKALPLCLLSVILLLAACGGDVRSRLTPAVSDSPHARDLVACAHIYNWSGDNNYPFCALDRLPLLGQEHQQIRVNEIMARTLVSHAWMAQRFEQLLGTSGDQLLK